MNERPVPSPSFEDWLGAELQRTAAVADDPRPAALVVQEVLRHRRSRVAPGRSRRWTPLLGLAAALLLPAALLIVGSQPTSPPPSAPWDALLVRPEADDAGSNTGIVQVVRVDPHGQERLVRRVDGAAIELPEVQDDWAFTGAALASEDGWLALELDSWSREPASDPNGGRSRDGLHHLTWWLLVALLEERPAIVVPYTPYDVDPLAAAGWASGGRFATLCPDLGAAPCGFERVPDLSVQLLDARSGSVRVGSGMALPQQSGQDRITWAADGSGLLTVGDRLPMDEIRRIRDERQRAGDIDLATLLQGELGIDPGDALDTPSSISRPSARVLGVPALAPGPGPRWVVEGGTWLEPDTATMHRPDGTTSDWAAGLPGGEALREASLAAHGASVWLLTGEAAEHPRWLRVRRATAPGTVDSRPDAEMIARPSGGDGSIAGVAPDDSIIAISVVRDWTARGAKVALVRTDGREAATIHDGRFAGFVPADLFPMP